MRGQESDPCRGCPSREERAPWPSAVRSPGTIQVDLKVKAMPFKLFVGVLGHLAMLTVFAVFAVIAIAIGGAARSSSVAQRCSVS